MGFMLVIIGLVIGVLALVKFVKTRADLLKEDERDLNSSSIALWMYICFPVGIYKAFKYRNDNNKGWYIKFITYIMPPVGLYLLWKGNTFNLKNKKRLTKLIVIILVGNLMLLVGGIIFGNEARANLAEKEVQEELDREKYSFKEDETFEMLYPIESEDKSKVGFINESGQVVLEPEFSFVGVFSEGLAFVSNDEGKYYIDVTGEKVITLPTGCYGSEFNNGMAVFENEVGLFGVINNSGEIVLEAEYNYISKYSNGYAQVRKDEISSVVDKNGKTVLELGKNTVTSFNEEGIASYNVDGKVGYINIKGEVIIEPQYDYGYDFVNGYAIVQETFESNKHLVINSKNEVVNEIELESISSIFKSGVYVASQGGYYGCINEKGEVIVDFKYIETLPIESSILPGTVDGVNWTFDKADGSVAIPQIYTRIIEGFKGELAKVIDEDGNEVYINKAGEVVSN